MTKQKRQIEKIEIGEGLRVYSQRDTAPGYFISIIGLADKINEIIDVLNEKQFPVYVIKNEGDDTKIELIDYEVEVLNKK